MISGGLDLSVAATAALCGVVIGALQASLGVWPAVFLAHLGVGALVGLVNGFLVTYVGINSLITTLGMLVDCQGSGLCFFKRAYYTLCSILTGEKQTAYDAFAKLSEGTLLGVYLIPS